MLKPQNSKEYIKLLQLTCRLLLNTNGRACLRLLLGARRVTGPRAFGFSYRKIKRTLMDRPHNKILKNVLWGFSKDSSKWNCRRHRVRQFHAPNIYSQLKFETIMLYRRRTHSFTNSSYDTAKPNCESVSQFKITQIINKTVVFKPSLATELYKASSLYWRIRWKSRSTKSKTAHLQ